MLPPAGETGEEPLGGEMYAVNFFVESFGSMHATTTEKFSVTGSAKIRVREDKDRFFRDPLSERRWYIATSQQPFVVVVSGVSTGANEHLNGNLRVFVACHSEGVDDNSIEMCYSYEKRTE